MSVGYILRRLGLFLIVIWVAGTFNFMLPRLGGQNPIREKLVNMASISGAVQANMEEMIKEYETKFGLDKPLWDQYWIYVGDMTRGDFGFSISNYPRRVQEMIGEALPWSIVLLLVTSILAFIIGNTAGALIAWPKSPKWLSYVMTPFLMLSSLPYFLFGLILVYIFGFALGLFPMYGGYTLGTVPSWDLKFFVDLLWHACLPALSILLVSLGGWALGMRALMIMTQGEDFMIFAEAKGLKDGTRFLRYGVRNALLPQITALALVLGHVVSGAVLVEVIFGYPGIGTMLYQAIRGSDYYLVQGIVFIVIVSIGVATFLLDVLYPTLDPRITYRRA